MRKSILTFGWFVVTIGILSSGGTAHALPRDDRSDEEIAERQQQAAAQAAANPEERPGTTVPEARTGFQLGFRSGVSIPLGRVSDVPGDAMNKSFAFQVPLLLELGAKPWKHLFVGGYFGVGFGASATGPGAACSQCSTTSIRYGLEAIVSLRPEERTNPWLGYGIGFESTGLGSDYATVTLFGPEFARLSAGVDFRVSRKFGVGPIAEFSLGRYDSFHTDARSRDVLRPGALPSTDGDVDPRALHHWLTFGLRFVAFP